MEPITLGEGFNFGGIFFSEGICTIFFLKKTIINALNLKYEFAYAACLVIQSKSKFSTAWYNVAQCCSATLCFLFPLEQN